jgi:hypothetical protein
MLKQLSRQNEWFKKNLPDYLQPLPNTEENENMIIDDTLISELSKVQV